MGLSFMTKLGYGLGHILNDLCASVWFTYGLVFYNDIIGLTNIDSGLLLLIGQIVDGIATPIVGILSDRVVISTFLYDRYGRRKTWHLIGTIGILVSMPLMFTPCIQCEDSSDIYKSTYYSCLIILFQICWAIVQISHLSLASDLSLNPKERTTLLSFRTTFAVLSNIIVYSVAWIVLSSDSSESHLSASDTFEFQIIIYTIVLIGAFTSLVFHASVKEVGISHDEVVQGTSERRSIATLFKKVTLYEVACVYMCARLFGNMIQVLIPFYVPIIMTIGVSSIAIIPFVMFVSSFLTSLYVGAMNNSIGRQWSFFFGSTTGAIGILAIFFGKGQIYSEIIIYGTVIFLGNCQSTYLITSLATIADFIGTDVHNSAFIYGIMSLTDKLSSGAAIMVVQALKPEHVTYFFHYALSVTCGAAILLGTIVMFLTYKLLNPNPEERTVNVVQQKYGCCSPDVAVAG